MSFALASAIERIDSGPKSGTFRVLADPAWFQGRGVFGGLSAAWLLRAMGEVVGNPTRHPRDLSGTFCAPIKAGECLIEARVLREGLSVSFVSAELRQRGKVAGSASAVFSSPRQSSLEFAELPLPPARPPEESKPWTLPGGLPSYADNFELRHCLGVPFLSGERGAESGVWVRSRAPEPVDAALITGLLDCYAPAFFTRRDSICPAGTISWSVHYLAEFPRPAASPEDYHLLRVRSEVAAGGYSSEDDELWAADGTLVARARQLVAAV